MADPGNPARWRLVILMSAIGMVGIGMAAHFSLGWKAASVMTALEFLVVLAYGLRTRDPIIQRLLLFGILVGFGELPADAFSVQVTDTLVYPAHEPHLWASPAYMPISWFAVMVQGGFMAWALRERLGMLWATLLMAAIGASYVPLYEYLARNAGFWFYRDCPMLLGHTPYYVILAEALLVGALPWLMKDLPTLRPATIGLRALGESLIILAASILAFALLG